MRSLTRRTTASLALAATAGVIIPLAVTTTPVQADEVAPIAPAVAMLAPGNVSAAEAASARAALRHQRAVALRNKLIALARTKLRSGQYVAGAASANRFDCSGFTLMLYKTVAHIRIPHYSGAQMARAKPVKRSELLPGDLLFWGPGGSQHASIYIGHGKMIGANNPRSDVKIDSINSSYWAPRYAGAGRLIWG